jgi:hypothetical protein
VTFRVWWPAMPSNAVHCRVSLDINRPLVLCPNLALIYRIVNF